MGLADCRCGSLNCSETVSVVHRRSRPQIGSSKLALTSKCLALALVGLLCVAHWHLPAESKRIHTASHPDHSDHDDYDDDHDRSSPDLPAGADLDDDDDDDDNSENNDNPDHLDGSDGDSDGPDHSEDEDADGAQSRADLPAPAASSKSSGVALKMQPTSAKPNSASTTAKSADLTKKIESDHSKDAAGKAEDATRQAKAKSPKKVQLDKAIKGMEAEAKRVEAKKNNTIIINGRRFDQVKPVECVDEQFYAMLMKDLSLINPTETQDEYETYYDSERAKAISAIVDAPDSKLSSAFGRQLELAAGKGGDKLVDAAAGSSGDSRAALPELEPPSAEELDKDMTSQQLIQEIKEFWRQTNKTYSETSQKLSLKFKRRKRSARKQPFHSRAALDGATSTSTSTAKPKTTTRTSSKAKITTTTSATTTTTASPKPKTTAKTTAKTAATTSSMSKGTTTTSSKPASSVPTKASPTEAAKITAKPTTPSVASPGKQASAPKPNYKKALENHYYLMRRLEELKSMLLNGEEALIILNNRVKKLQQAVGENELKRALCSCITSRGGRAALMLMSELFTDKNALKMLAQLDQAELKAELAARDTAEFCAYWYGDTLRSQALIKEKQIKRLIVKIKGEYERHTRKQVTENHTITTTSVSYIKDGNSTLKVVRRETRIKVVKKVVEMTRLWRPELSLWIENELGPDFVKELGSGMDFGCNSSGLFRPRRRAQLEADEMFMSTPFDQDSLYSDVDDGDAFETSAILQSFVANNFRPPLMRGRRATGSTSTRKPPKTSTTSSKRPTAPASTTKRAASSTTRKASSSTTKKAASSTTRKAPSSTTTKAASSTTKKASATGPVTHKPPTTGKPSAQLTSTLAPKVLNATANFEDRVSRSASKCARDGFTVLLDIAYEQNAILYEASKIKRDIKYIETLRESFIASFAKFWVEKRNDWSHKLTANSKNMSMASFNCYDERRTRNETSTKTISRNETTSFRLPASEAAKMGPGPKSGGDDADGPLLISIQAQFMSIQAANKSVDDLIDDALEPTGDAYERGARLGFTIGKFIGEKAARQWPDPLELNTFTYDSLFLAGVGHNFDAQQTRQLEDLIVTEAAKRVAFTEASRLAFAKALHAAYLNGAFVVPEFGVLHGQRAISKRAATEGAQVGFAAASKSAAEFAPAAVKFFRLHEHQRSLAEPYKRGNKSASASNSTSRGETTAKKSLLGRIEEVRAESELNANIMRVTLDCGQKTGAVMGALVALLVTPEAFETYARVRGSLEGVESEFYRYKLGAMRGYELGESWAILNYTNAMAQNMDSFRADIGRSDLVGPTRNPTATTTTSTTTTTTTRTPTKLAASKKPGPSKKANLKHLPDDKMLSTVADTEPKKTNANNVFQFMVVNYGERLIANHSKGGMLTFRALAPLDEATLSEMKTQSGDMVAPTANSSKRKDEDEDIFETVKVAGELSGSLKARPPGSKPNQSFPFKLEILDLGPIIEFSEFGANNTSARRRANSLEALPLTYALSKVNKIYVKLRVARQNGSDIGTAQAADVLEAYLNNDQTDVGDGFMCGSYSSLGTNSTQPRQTEDDLALESAILDELYQRIEDMKPGQDAVAATEWLMRVTTAAPSRVTPFGSSTASASTTSRLNVAKMTTSGPTGSSKSTPTAAAAAAAAATTTTTTGKPTSTSTSKRVSTSTKKPASTSTSKRATTTTSKTQQVSTTSTTRADTTTTKRASSTTTRRAPVTLATKASNSRASLLDDSEGADSEYNSDSDSNPNSSPDSDSDSNSDSGLSLFSTDGDSGEQEFVEE